MFILSDQKTKCDKPYITKLSDFVIVTVQGTDSLKYLQGQFTSDLHKLSKDAHTLTAHCNVLGKMLSVLRIFHYKEGFAYIQRRSILEAQLSALKKYSIFSKVNIQVEETLDIYGITQVDLKCFFDNTDNKEVLYQDGFIVLKINDPFERFIVISKENHPYMHKIREKATYCAQDLWLALDIKAKYPIIDKPLLEKLLPLEVDLHQIGGVSFDKGCYMGQEGIAKLHYMGNGTRSIYWLSGNCNALPCQGEPLLLHANSKSQRRKGIVLASVRVSSKEAWIQAVLPKEIKYTDRFSSLQEPDNSFFHAEQ